MQFPDPLIRGRLQRRYKRFLSDVTLDDGSEVVAHCANPGSMLGLAEPGAPVWLSPSRNPARKLKYSWELVEVPSDGGSALVGINTGRANALVAEGLEAGKVPELAGYAERRAEVRYGANSRVDFLLEAPERPACYVEVKSVTLKRQPGLAEFPDAVTARGTKHLGELAEMVRQGQRAVLFFLAQRGDCDRVAPAADIDPAYAEALDRALAAGVEILCYQCNLSPAGITLDERLPLAL
ncbi:DNA/RNA nuclease SfsA [Pelagibius marinus]|uniref:DNA/RNA nuclease SfsA n=1 Tax=Pelagibius marinus TaxID=2762760 RepID=UPI001872A013|nr:DNA/RNA nuclease SfsA [Pelagibius marinus]